MVVVVDTDCGPKELRGQQLGAARLDVIKTACKAFPGLDPAACRLVTENGLCVDRLVDGKAYIVTGKPLTVHVQMAGSNSFSITLRNTVTPRTTVEGLIRRVDDFFDVLGRGRDRRLTRWVYFQGHRLEPSHSLALYNMCQEPTSVNIVFSKDCLSRDVCSAEDGDREGVTLEGKCHTEGCPAKQPLGYGAFNIWEEAAKARCAACGSLLGSCVRVHVRSAWYVLAVMTDKYGETSTSSGCADAGGKTLPISASCPDWFVAVAPLAAERSQLDALIALTKQIQAAFPLTKTLGRREDSFGVRVVSSDRGVDFTAAVCSQTTGRSLCHLLPPSSGPWSSLRHGGAVICDEDTMEQHGLSDGSEVLFVRACSRR